MSRIIPFVSRWERMKSSSTCENTSTMALPMPSTSKIAAAMKTSRRKPWAGAPALADRPCSGNRQPLLHGAMITAAFRAIGDIASPEFRDVLLKSIGLTIVLFVAIILATIFALDTLKLVPWGWAESILDVAASLGIAVLAIFLMAPVTAMFAGFFLDRVAG